MTQARVSQLASEAVLSPDSDARLSQLATEAVVAPEPDALISQATVEAIVAPTDAAARLGQVVIEAIFARPQRLFYGVLRASHAVVNVFSARTTQLVVEAVVWPDAPRLRATQMVAEAVVAPTSTARCSQFVVEVLYPVV